MRHSEGKRNSYTQYVTVTNGACIFAIFIRLLHCVQFPLMLEALRITGLATEPFIRGPRRKQYPNAGHQSFLKNGNVPKNVSVLTCPLLLSRIVIVVTLRD